jgi:hypothetical protein
MCWRGPRSREWTWEDWQYEVLAAAFQNGFATVFDEEEGEGVWAYWIEFHGNIYVVVG